MKGQEEKMRVWNRKCKIGDVIRGFVIDCHFGGCRRFTDCQCDRDLWVTLLDITLVVKETLSV